MFRATPTAYPKVTFGMIVLNGEPFILYNLRAIYPYAHEIIVVEGASPLARDSADESGHSLDGTLDTLRSFVTNEDPERKVILMTAEDVGYPDGFWPGEKDEQSRAYAKRATGDWLWQIDVDEFYRDDDMEKVLMMLQRTPSITAVSFYEMPFWGSFDIRCDGIYLGLYGEFHRLFRWRPSYSMVTHRPPTVVDENQVSLRDIHWVRGSDMKKARIYLYHYSQVFVDQMRRKSKYYDRMNARHVKPTDQWLDESFFSLKHPYRVHMVNTWPSWLERYAGDHPTQINLLRADIAEGKVTVRMRDMGDVYHLLDSRHYRLGIELLKLGTDYVLRTVRLVRRLLGRKIGLRAFLSEWLSVIAGANRLFPRFQD